MIRALVIATTSAVALCSVSAFTQERRQDTAPIPDFSGVWGNPYLYGIEPARLTPYAELRVQAMDLRDRSGRNITEADWREIERLLIEAYAALGAEPTPAQTGQNNVAR